MTAPTVCADCAKTMPPQITGPLAQAAWEEMTHLGILIRSGLGERWHETYLELQSGYMAMVEEHSPARLAQ